VSELIHEQLSRAIIGAAMNVLNEMKPGLDEKLYERALVIELWRRGRAVESQTKFPVFYQTELIGNQTPDLIVDGKGDRRSDSRGRGSLKPTSRK
jgi:GxxExxY protein